MKKIALLLALVMVFSMAACDVKVPDSLANPTEAPATAEPTQAPEAEETPEPTEEPEEEPVNSAIEDASLDALRAEMGSNLLAVSYFGFVEGDDAMPIEELAAEYSFVDMIGQGSTVILAGNDCYCIVPASPNAKLTIESYDMEKDSREVVFEGNGNPVLLRCNYSDIISNAIVTVEIGGQTLEYRPCLSLENGKLAQHKDVLDFTHYTEAEAEENSVEAEPQNSEAAYADILNQYRNAIAEKLTPAELNDAGLNFMIGDIVVTMEKPNGVGYRIVDFDGNGVDELIIAATDELDDDFFGKLVFELYTLENGKPVQLFTSMERNRYYYAGNSDFAHVASGSAFDTLMETVSLQNGVLEDIPVSIEPAGYIQLELDPFARG